MGSCASVDKKSSVSVMKMMSFPTKSEKLEIPESPKKENAVANAPAQAVNGGRPIKPRWSFASTNKSFGSKEETFYDSQPWLESDCEDDFYSVGGDFTPSRGNTPIQGFSGRTPRATNALFEDKAPGSIINRAPAQRRKKLFELFRESIREEFEGTGEQEGTSGNLRESSKKSGSKVTTTAVHNSSYVSGASSSDFTVNEAFDAEKGKDFGSGQRCLPGLVSCGSFLDKKRKMSSAAMAVK